LLFLEYQSLIFVQEDKYYLPCLVPFTVTSLLRHVFLLSKHPLPLPLVAVAVAVVFFFFSLLASKFPFQSILPFPSSPKQANPLFPPLSFFFPVYVFILSFQINYSIVTLFFTFLASIPLTFIFKTQQPKNLNQNNTFSCFKIRILLVLVKTQVMIVDLKRELRFHDESLLRWRISNESLLSRDWQLNESILNCVDVDNEYPS